MMRSILRYLKFWFSTTAIYFLLSTSLLASDTIRVMQYNLLYYDMITSFCTESNNNITRKNLYLTQILNHFKPDIFTVNEMNASPSSVNLLLNDALNVNGIDYYKSAKFTGSYLINMLYYNSEKLHLEHQSHIQTSPRQTDVYTLYYKSDDLAEGDTTFFTCIVTHLKAGTGLSNENERANSANLIMKYISNRKLKGNIMLMGDFNVYTHEEEAFQTFITSQEGEMYFNDPADAVGSWHKNPDYAKYHTQSTHKSGGCPSGGGMDDRFDFILMTSPLIDGTKGARYIEDTYWAYGQDGLRLNSSLISPANTSLPSQILDALYGTSDHLPVTAKIHVNHKQYINAPLQYRDPVSIRTINPFAENLVFEIQGIQPQEVLVSIHDATGRSSISSKLWVTPNMQNTISTSRLMPGIYFVSFKGKDFLKTQVVIKQ